MDSVSPFDQAQLLAEYADLRQRAAALDEQVPACLQRISDTLPRISGESELADHYRSLLVGARSNALVSIENYHEAIPYLQAAESLIAQLNGHPDVQPDGQPGGQPAASGQVGARGALLDRLDELIDAAVGMIDLAEQCFNDAQATDPDTVPASLLDDPLHPDA
ncbi:ATPase [Paraburkholderia caribensis]|uniref:ATPase n=1 Tax=Paraburkholderia caribensis TaxID=75105 RepID=UPI001591F026|nr:ATPase [Paraburkholderia caribensis]